MTLNTGTKTVDVVWYGNDDQVPPSPQWFAGQARKHGGKVRLIGKGDRRREWAGSRTVRYTFYREGL